MTNNVVDDKLAIDNAVEQYSNSGTVEDMLKVIGAMEAMIRSKGYERGYGNNVIVDMSEDKVELRIRAQDEDFDNKYIARTPSADKESIDVALRQMAHEVISLRTHADIMRGKWRQRYADLIDKGEQLRVNDAYLAVLRAEMDRMSENVLEAPKEEF